MNLLTNQRDLDFLSEDFSTVTRPLAYVNDTSKVLFAPGWGLGLGDQCMCLPLLRALMERYSPANITLFTDRPDFWKWRSPTAVSIIAQRKRESLEVLDYLNGFDLVVAGYYPGCLGAFARCSALTVFCAGERLTEFRSFYKDGFGCREIPLTSCRVSISEVHKFVALFVDFGICPASDATELTLPVPSRPETRLRARYPKRAHVLIHPGAAKSYKEWPIANWQNLAIDLVDRKIDVAVSSGTSVREATLARSISDVSPSVVNLPPLSLPCFVNRLREFDLVVSADTAMPHLAAQLGYPASLAIYGPTDPIRFCPPSPSSYFVSPFSISREDALESVCTCLNLTSGRFDRVALHGNVSRLAQLGASLCASVQKAQRLLRSRSNERELELLAREYRNNIRPECRLLMAGASEHFDKAILLLRHRRSRVGLDYFVQSSVFRSARQFSNVAAHVSSA